MAKYGVDTKHKAEIGKSVPDPPIHLEEEVNDCLRNSNAILRIETALQLYKNI
jgi:hypothetical protein